MQTDCYELLKQKHQTVLKKLGRKIFNQLFSNIPHQRVFVVRPSLYRLSPVVVIGYFIVKRVTGSPVCVSG